MASSLLKLVCEAVLNAAVAMPIAFQQVARAALKNLAVAALLLANPAMAQLQVENPWVPLAPPGARVYAVYMTLINNSATPLTLVGLESDCCAHGMLHATRQQEGRVIMEHLDTVEIPAQGQVHLQPGGVHVMLMGPKAPLAEGDGVMIVLRFADGSRHAITAKVIHRD